MTSFTKCIRNVSPFMLLLVLPTEALSQVSCGDAVLQLQRYVAGVNQQANYWYHQGIPQRCFGNQFCANAMLQQLNYWYQQQSGYVNNWYYQISAGCTSNAPAPPPSNGGGEIGDLSQQPVEQLDVDDEDKTVAIRIPENPKGYIPQQ